MSAMFDLGAYAAFVWPAYGVSILGLLATVGVTWRAYTRAKARVDALEKK